MFKDYLHLHLIIFLWGFTALVGKWTSLSAMELVWYRTLLAVFALFFLLRYRKVPVSLPKARQKILFSGGLVALHWVCFFAAVQYSTVSICLIGLASTAFWTALLQPLFFRQAWQKAELVVGSLVIVGMAAVAQFEPKYWLGLALSLVSALCASSFTMLNARFIRSGEHPLRITYYQMFGALGFVSVFLTARFALGFSVQLKLENYLIDGLCLIFLAWICTVYAYAAAVELMKRISPFVINLSVNMEPVYGIAAAALLLSEYQDLTLAFYFSTLWVMLCVLIYPIWQAWQGRKQAQKNEPKAVQESETLTV